MDLMQSGQCLLMTKTEILFAIQYKMLIEKSETRPCKIQEEIDKTVEMWKAENVKYRFPIRILLIVAPNPGDWGKFFQPGLAYQNETIQTSRSQIKIPDGLIFIVMTKEMLFDLFGKEVVEQVVQIAEKKMDRRTQKLEKKNNKINRHKHTNTHTKKKGGEMTTVSKQNICPWCGK